MAQLAPLFVGTTEPSILSFAPRSAARAPRRPRAAPCVCMGVRRPRFRKESDESFPPPPLPPPTSQPQPQPSPAPPDVNSNGADLGAAADSPDVDARERALGNAATAPGGPLQFCVLGKKFTLSGRVMLMLVPFMWGSFTTLTKWLYQMPWALNPILFNSLRLIVGLVFFVPTLVKELRDARSGARTDGKEILVAGAELGLWTFLANVLQLYALRYTTASRASFISQLATIIVPVAAFAVGLEQRLRWQVCVASLMALCGVGLLTLDSVGGGATLAGDGLMVVSAFVAAAYILRSRLFSTQVRTGPLVAIKILFQTLMAISFSVFISARAGTLRLSALAATFSGATPLWITVNFALVLWGGMFVSAASTWLQVRGQSVVPPSQTVVIFSLTPLWACALAIPLGEMFGTRGVLGALAIVASTLLAGRGSSPTRDRAALTPISSARVAKQI